MDQLFTVADNTTKVTGIIENVPENSHLQFDVLASITSVTAENPEFNDRWGSNFLVTYLELVDDVDLQNMKSKFPDFMVKHMPLMKEMQMTLMIIINFM